MIRKVSIRNYRNLKSVDLELFPINLIVGPNNSGKSNFLNAVALLGQLCRGAVPEAFGAGPRAFEQILYRGAPIDSSIELGVELDGLELPEGRDSAAYRVAIRRTSPEAPFEVTDESLRVWSSADPDAAVTLFETDDRRKLKFDDQVFSSNRDTIMFQFRGSSRHPEIGILARALSRQRTYRFDPWVSGTPCEDVDTRDLGHDGRNLPAVLYTIRSTQPEVYEAIERELAAMMPEFQRITLPVINNRARALGLIEQAFDSPFTAREVSDGVLLSIALTTLAHLDTAPGLIAIERPDQGIHPARMPAVLDMFRRLSEADEFPKQVILTSQAPHLLGEFEDDPDVIVVARREGGESILTPLVEMEGGEEQLKELTRASRALRASELLKVAPAPDPEPEPEPEPAAS